MRSSTWSPGICDEVAESMVDCIVPVTTSMFSNSASNCDIVWEIFSTSIDSSAEFIVCTTVPIDLEISCVVMAVSIRLATASKRDASFR
eukprot:CAMPEP_0182526974 /NCGR_PEP_ID=MMETSP1323-20130603/3561_1 /TAXON_ID=236787 /ORGANISM="Florenciella parvula, Strain RCC1693" /LENGTH=88 /DNA_ID=CAMNT_0024735917 /DNA_START=355 /DNA_END=621 /DNA_ORIENTATION=+